RARAAPRDTRRDRLGARHRRPEDGGGGGERAALPGAGVRGRDALPATAQLHRSRLRARAGGGPHRALGRQGAGPDARREGLRRGRGRRARIVTAHFVGAYKAFATNGAAGAPPWLKEIREGAIARFAEVGFPTTRLEQWRFTSVQQISETPFEL